MASLAPFYTTWRGEYRDLEAFAERTQAHFQTCMGLGAIPQWGAMAAITSDTV